MQDLSNHAPEKLTKMLVGLKLDLVQSVGGDSLRGSVQGDEDLDGEFEPRCITYKKAAKFAKDNGMTYMELSSKHGY